MLIRLSSALKLLAGLLALAVLVGSMILLLIPLLPWRIRRIWLTNFYGTAMGKTILWISRCPLAIEGHESVRSDRPAIYVGNHTSILDAFTSIWLSPRGTVGIAKKEVIYYPFYGQAWFLSGHLTVDRGAPERARASLNQLASFVRENGLHVFIWPEGTRSKDGRLLPFKKGVVHLALRTGLPIIPMVTSGAHLAWQKSGLVLRKVPIRIQFLPAIDTSQWREDCIDAHLEEVRRAFVDHLPPDQRPLETSEPDEPPRARTLPEPHARAEY